MRGTSVISTVFCFQPQENIVYGAKSDVLEYIYNSYAGILGEFLSNQDPFKRLMLDEALKMRVHLSLSYLEFPKI